MTSVAPSIVVWFCLLVGNEIERVLGVQRIAYFRDI